MKFIVGVGNPEKKYEGTRHNVGFAVLDALKKNHKSSAVLVKPSTYVNRTGVALREIVDQHHPALGDILVVCDDANLVFGKLRLRRLGSAGGHHGLLSAIETLGSEDFPRLRIGVKNESTPQDLAPFVLEKFDKEEKKALARILDNAVLVCETWAAEGFEAALNQLSRLK